MSRPLQPELADDPVWQAILRAPNEDETPEEVAMAAMTEALGGAPSPQPT